MVKDKMVVSISYTLKNDAGEIIDQTDGNEPLDYLHAANNIIPGLENALEGKAVNDSFDVTVAPEEGYGLRHDELQNTVSREMFAGIDDEHIQVGAQFEAEIHDGLRIVTIAAVNGDEITLDANHPLAGETLHFVGKIEAVREATEEELSHGHVHAAGGCGHDH